MELKRLLKKMVPGNKIGEQIVEKQTEADGVKRSVDKKF